MIALIVAIYHLASRNLSEQRSKNLFQCVASSVCHLEKRDQASRERKEKLSPELSLGMKHSLYSSSYRQTGKEK